MIHAVSRHGLLPQAHRESTPSEMPPVHLDALLCARTTRAATRAIRAEVRAACSRGDDWRTVVDALRPHTQALWQQLGEVERRRFLRHASRYWEVHRHRMAPPVARTISALRDSGRLCVTSGRVEGYRVDDAQVGVIIRTRRHERCAVRVGHVVNCTGPGSDIVHAGDPVIDSLVEAGVARAGPVELGLDVDDSGALVDASGAPSRTLWTIGSLQRGQLWETTAVPEIRAQAASLARALTQA